MYSDILLTVDFDRTLTGPDSLIPQRNIEAIEYFIANGGKFTVNTGRSTATFWQYLDTLPTNAPFLLYNGSAAWEKGVLSQMRIIDLDVWQTMDKVTALFPDMTLEIQGEKLHYLVHDAGGMAALYKNLQWRWAYAEHGQDTGPFLKFALFGPARKPVVADMYDASEEELRRFDEAESILKDLYGDRVEVFRAAPRIIDVHAKGVSKLAATRALQKKLGRKILVCVGDSYNDIPMLTGADYAFCPGDAVIGEGFPTVCDCAKGAVADVIYEKIPEILANKP